MQTAQQQANGRRRGLRVLGAVMLAALTAAASLPLAGPAAARASAAQSPTALTPPPRMRRSNPLPLTQPR